MQIIYFIIGLITSIIGFAVHHSYFWAVVDFFFWGFAWIKWIVFHEVTLTLIKHAFDWFFA